MSPQGTLEVPDGMVVRRSAVGALGLYPVDGPTRPANGRKALDGVRAQAAALQGGSVDYSPEERYALLKVTGLTHEVLLAEVAEVKYDTSPVGTPGGRQNWVDKAGGLPPFIRAVAHALIRSGKSKSRAIAIAVGTIKRWARGGGNVTAKTRAKAAATIARWEAMKARSGKEWAMELATKTKHTSSDFKPCGRCGSNRVSFPPGKQPRCAACQFHVGLKDSAREKKANYTPEENRRRGEAALAAGGGSGKKKPRSGGAKKPKATGGSTRRIVRTEEGAARYNARIGDIIENGKVVGHDDGEQFREIGADGTSSIVEAADAAATGTRNASAGKRKAKAPLKSARGTSPNGSDLEKFENGRAKYKDGSIYTTDGWVSPPKRSPSGAKPAKVREDGSVIYSDGQVFDPATGKVALPKDQGYLKKVTDTEVETKALLLSSSLVDITMEFKGIIRHVRTAAGVARFKQPIGSIIIAKTRQRLDNLTGRPPVWEGYERVKGANGKLYDIGKEDDGRWYAYDTAENVVAEDDDQEAVYKQLNDIAKKRLVKPKPKPIAKKPVEKPAAPERVKPSSGLTAKDFKRGEWVTIGNGPDANPHTVERVNPDGTLELAPEKYPQKRKANVPADEVFKMYPDAPAGTDTHEAPKKMFVGNAKPGDQIQRIDGKTNTRVMKTVRTITSTSAGYRATFDDGSNALLTAEEVIAKAKTPAAKKPLVAPDPKPVKVPERPVTYSPPLNPDDDKPLPVPKRAELAALDDRDLLQRLAEYEEDYNGDKALAAVRAEMNRRKIVVIDDLEDGDEFTAGSGSALLEGRDFRVVTRDRETYAVDMRSGQEYVLDEFTFGEYSRLVGFDAGGTTPLFGAGSKPKPQGMVNAVAAPIKSSPLSPMNVPSVASIAKVSGREIVFKGNEKFHNSTKDAPAGQFRKRLTAALQDAYANDPEFKAYIDKNTLSRLTPDAAIARESQRLIKDWLESSSSPYGIALQRAARELLAPDSDRSWTTGDKFAKQRAQAEILMPVARVAAKAIYEETQADLKRRGITSISLARGYVQGGVKALPGEVNITSNSLSSWSTNMVTAASFTHGSAIFVSEVPAERIFSGAWLNLGDASESEVIVLGNKNDRVTNIVRQWNKEVS